MIAGFSKVLAASPDDRRNLFVGAGIRMGIVEQNIEKDFWVCWTLDALFNGQGTRRWCSMRLCGNRYKVAAYADRKRRRARMTRDKE